jgi:hypothetical protein
MPLQDLIEELSQEIAHTNHQFPALGVQPQPIPFFGKVENAEVLTIGVNPSQGEFAPWRNWPRDLPLPASELIERLTAYFQGAPAGPHPWFLPWEVTLNRLGWSYKEGRAAHLDLSPRATMAMSLAASNGHGPLFRAMVLQDLGWLFRELRFCSSARVLMVAGQVIGPKDRLQSIGDFLREDAGNHGFNWQDEDGEQALVANDETVNLSVFQSPTGPSAKNPYLMIACFEEQREGITVALNR